MRFVGQGYEINVPLPKGPYKLDDIEYLRKAFFDVYSTTYGDRTIDTFSEIAGVHWRVNAVIEREPFSFALTKVGIQSLKGSRSVFFPEAGGFVNCPVHDRYSLGSGDIIHGPAIIEERESTIVLIPGSSAVADKYSNIMVTI